jgi:hypothetical protein
MRENLVLDTAVFQDFDAVHACFPRCLGLSLVPHVIELLFLG